MPASLEKAALGEANSASQRWSDLDDFWSGLRWSASAAPWDPNRGVASLVFMSASAPYTSGAVAHASSSAALVFADLVAQCFCSASATTLGFDQSLDDLERQRVITPQERMGLETGRVGVPIRSNHRSEACRDGALSREECASGVVTRSGSPRVTFQRSRTQPFGFRYRHCWPEEGEASVWSLFLP